MNIENLSAGDLNWLIWGFWGLLLIVTFNTLRNKKLIVQLQEKVTHLSSELKKINLGPDADTDVDETKLYVGNIDYAASEAELAAHFAKFGQIDMVNIPVDRYTGRARGFGFVTFKKPNDARKAMDLDGSEFKGRQIQVNFARERAST